MRSSVASFVIIAAAAPVFAAPISSQPLNPCLDGTGELASLGNSLGDITLTRGALSGRTPQAAVTACKRQSNGGSSGPALSSSLTSPDPSNPGQSSPSLTAAQNTIDAVRREIVTLMSRLSIEPLTPQELAQEGGSLNGPPIDGKLLTRHVNSRAPKPLSSIGKGLIGTGVGLVGSTVAQDGINEIEKAFKREIVTLMTRQSTDAESAAALNKPLDSEGGSSSHVTPEKHSQISKLSSRTPKPLSSIGKGLIGTGVGLVGSTVAQDAINKVTKAFQREVDLD